jgi:hypothetical protein
MTFLEALFTSTCRWMGNEGDGRKAGLESRSFYGFIDVINMNKHTNNKHKSSLRVFLLLILAEAGNKCLIV